MRDLLLRWRIRASNYGRDFGWAVLRDGLKVGELVDPIWEDMFWHSYRICAPVCPPPGEPRFQILDSRFWADIDGLAYTNLVLGLPAKHAFPALEPLQQGRAWMRGLYL